MTRLSIRQYQRVSTNNVADADPHTLISLVLQHTIGNLAASKGAIAQKNIEAKNKALTKAIALIGELQDSLDMDKGGEVSENLAALYDYMVRRITQANIENSQDMVDEVIVLVTNIKEGWDAIPVDVRQQYDTAQGA